MCYARRKIEGGVGALRESDDTNFLKPNGQSRNLNVYGKISLYVWGFGFGGVVGGLAGCTCTHLLKIYSLNSL